MTKNTSHAGWSEGKPPLTLEEQRDVAKVAYRKSIYTQNLLARAGFAFLAVAIAIGTAPLVMELGSSDLTEAEQQRVALVAPWWVGSYVVGGVGSVVLLVWAFCMKPIKKEIAFDEAERALSYGTAQENGDADPKANGKKSVAFGGVLIGIAITAPIATVAVDAICRSRRS